MSRKSWFWLVAVVAAVGLGLWYAHAHSWLDPANAWVRHLMHKDNPKMDMNMPGMNMEPANGTAGKSTKVPDHTDVTLSREVRQRIGVTVGKVEEAPLRMTIRTVGIVEMNETKVTHVHLRTEGWVNEVFVNFTGQKVKKGDPLLTIYSPQFLTTQQEFLNARQAKQPAVAEMALRRLELWDVPAEEIKQLESTRKPHTNLTLRSPRDGTVMVKNAFAGQYVTADKELYVLADLSTVWVQAKVYEYELPHVKKGQPATVTLSALPEKEFTGKVVFLQPTVDEKTRTVQVRIELPNQDGLLRPGMFANAVLEHLMGSGLLVPESAVLRSGGEQDLAFRVESEGRFVPVAVKISPLQFERGRLQILKGLKAGDRVVTSANFLIDSESRLRADGAMASMPGMNMGDVKGMGKRAAEPKMKR